MIPFLLKMGPYTTAHVKTQGAGDARPTALQVIEDQALRGTLSQKIIVITGTTSGIGIETARALLATGARLFLTIRNRERAEAIPADIIESGRVDLVEMDNASLASIRSAASEILAKSKNQVNVLVNNAGVMGIQTLQLTEDGYEMQFATNYLGHFLLFHLLKPALLASSTPEFHSRVVNLTSTAHRAYTLSESDNYNYERGGYELWHAYGHSKLAAIYMANEIDRRYGDRGLHGLSVHPGSILTNMDRHMGPDFLPQILSNEKVRIGLKSHEQGAATTVIAAVGIEWEGKGGKYLEDCEEAKRGADDYNPLEAGFVHQTYHPENEKRLWEDSLTMLGLSAETD